MLSAEPAVIMVRIRPENYRDIEIMTPKISVG